MAPLLAREAPLRFARYFPRAFLHRAFPRLLRYADRSPKPPANGPIPITTIQINTQTRSGIDRNTFSARRAPQNILQRRPPSEIDRLPGESGSTRIKVDGRGNRQKRTNCDPINVPKIEIANVCSTNGPNPIRKSFPQSSGNIPHKTAAYCRETCASPKCSRVKSREIKTRNHIAAATRYRTLPNPEAKTLMLRGRSSLQAPRLFRLPWIRPPSFAVSAGSPNRSRPANSTNTRLTSWLARTRIDAWKRLISVPNASSTDEAQNRSGGGHSTRRNRWCTPSRSAEPAAKYRAGRSALVWLR